MTSASPAARWRAAFSKPKCWVRLSSPHERTPCTSRRASRTVQSCGPSSARSRARRTSALTKPQSNRALWATNTRPASAASTWSASSANGGASRTMALVMLVMAQIGRRDRPARVDQRVEHDLAPAAVHHHHRDLGDPVAAAGPHPGGLDVHHREGALVEQRRALRLGHQAPAPVGELAHPGVGAEQRDGDPLAHRRPARPAGRAPGGTASRRLAGPGAARCSTRSSSVLSGCADRPDHSGGPPERQRHAAGAAAAPRQLGALDRDHGAVLGVGPVVEGQEVDRRHDPEARGLRARTASPRSGGSSRSCPGRTARKLHAELHCSRSWLVRCCPPANTGSSGSPTSRSAVEEVGHLAHAASPFRRCSTGSRSGPTKYGG